eukprot:Awhi_evm1s2682
MEYSWKAGLACCLFTGLAVFFPEEKIEEEEEEEANLTKDSQKEEPFVCCQSKKAEVEQ